MCYLVYFLFIWTTIYRTLFINTTPPKTCLWGRREGGLLIHQFVKYIDSRHIIDFANISDPTVSNYMLPFTAFDMLIN